MEDGGLDYSPYEMQGCSGGPVQRKVKPSRVVWVLFEVYLVNWHHRRIGFTAWGLFSMESTGFIRKGTKHATVYIR